MRVESLLSAFILVLGNSVLHFTLWILSMNVKVPSQEEIDELNAKHVITERGDLECPSKEGLLDAVAYAQLVHFLAFVILTYRLVHNEVWTFCVNRC